MGPWDNCRTCNEILRTGIFVPHSHDGAVEKTKDHEIDTIRNAADPSKWDRVQRTLYDETNWIWEFVEHFQSWSKYMYG